MDSTKLSTENTVPEQKFQRRQVAERRVEWLVKSPDPAVEDHDEYDRYETDRLEVMNLIKEECGRNTPHDLRVIEGEEETVISYLVQRVVLADEHGRTVHLK